MKDNDLTLTIAAMKMIIEKQFNSDCYIFVFPKGEKVAGQ